PALPDRLEFGEFGPVVTAGDGIGRRFDGGRPAAFGAQNLYDVGEVILTLDIVVGDLPEQRKRLAAVDRHQSRIAEGDLALFRRGILLLPDRHQFAVLFEEPAIPGRLVGAETDDGDIEAGSDLLACFSQWSR